MSIFDDDAKSMIKEAVINSMKKYFNMIEENIMLKIETSILKQLIRLQDRIEKLEKQFLKLKSIWDDELEGLYK